MIMDGHTKEESKSQKQYMLRLHFEFFCADQEEMPKPRLIVFVVGGVTYSEIRAAYEVAEQYPSHDVFIGTLDQLSFIFVHTTCV